MQFPQETIDWAKNKAEEIKKGYSKSLFNQAYGVYEKSQQIPYDFTEFLKNGQWSPWPHECKTINCQTGAACSFVMANELNLHPQIYGVVGLREKGQPSSSFHFLITANTGRKKDVIIDPRYSLFGYCEFEGNKIKIRDNSVTGHTCMEFDSLIPFTEEEYCAKVEQQRKPEERISVLHDGQSLGHFWIDHWLSSRFWNTDFYLKYNKETNTIETRGVYDRLLLQKRVIVLNSKLDEKGNIEHRTLSFYYAKKHNWMDFSELKHIATLPAEKVFCLSPLTKNLKVKNSVALDTIVRSLIFSGYSSDSFAQKTKNDFYYLEQISQICDESFSQFLENADAREIGMVAAEAGYQKAKKGKSNFKSHDELCSICEEWMKEYRKNSEKVTALTVKAYLTKARMKRTPHIWQTLRNIRKKDAELESKLENITALHKYDPETRFNAILDRYAYSEEVKSSPPKAEDFTLEELKSAYAGMLTEFLTLSADSSKRLLMQKSIDNSGRYMTNSPELSNETIPKKSHTNHGIVHKKDKFSLEDEVLNAVKANLNPERVITLPETSSRLETTEGTEQLIESSI